MKFDCVIGNPPYQETKMTGERKDQASNLWVKFWCICMRDLSKNQGIVSLVTPTSWLSPSKDLKGEYAINNTHRLWDVFNSYTTYADVATVARHFNNIGSSFGYAIVDKSTKNGLTFSDNSSIKLGFLPKSNTEQVELLLDLKQNLGSLFKITQVNSNNIRVCVPMTRKVTVDSIEILKGSISPTGGSDKDELYLYIHTHNIEIAKKVKSAIERSIDILNVHCRWSGFLNIQILKMIKFQKEPNR